MKPITLFATIALLASFTLIPGANWLTNFEQAKSEASQKNKYILLNFSGSDWCASCIRMKTEFFSSSAFIEFSDQNLVLANADFPRLKKNQLAKNQVEHNETLAERYNPEGKFPLTVLLDATGKALRRWDGIPQKSPGEFVEELKKFILSNP